MHRLAPGCTGQGGGVEQEAEGRCLHHMLELGGQFACVQAHLYPSQGAAEQKATARLDKYVFKYKTNYVKL